MQLLQPMQRSLSKSTMPSSRLNNAFVGQIATQGASVQWLHRSTPKARAEVGHCPLSMYFTHVRNCPTGTWCSVLHATVQAWQPMQVRWSMAKPYRTWFLRFRLSTGLAARCSSPPPSYHMYECPYYSSPGNGPSTGRALATARGGPRLPSGKMPGQGTFRYCTP